MEHMENTNIGRSKKDIISLICLVIFVTIIFTVIVIVFTPKNTNSDNVPTNFFKIKDIEMGFIYYNDSVYYKNPNVIIYDIDRIKGPVGKNEKHIKYDDVVDNKVVLDTENLCIYAYPVDTEVFAYEGRDDILLIKSDYAINNYFVYIKDVPPSESADKNNLSNYINGSLKADSYSIISYGMHIIPYNFDLSSFKSNNNNTFSFSSTDIEDGHMIYYLMLEDNGLYYIVRGEGNLLSNIVLLYSKEDGKEIQYMAEFDGWSDILLDDYAALFEIDEETKENLKDIVNNLDKLQENEPDKMEILNPDDNDQETIIRDKTQDDLINIGTSEEIEE